MSELERAMVMKHCSSLMDTFGYFVSTLSYLIDNILYGGFNVGLSILCKG